VVPELPFILMSGACDLSMAHGASLAEKEAMNACSQRGKACVLQTVFNKQCAALAWDRSFVGWATSTEPREARQKAVEECTKDGGTKCAIHVFFFSF
jgi:hypothetical protein